ncbi:MAG: hypothetical protein AAF799_06125 [Myxococcota bacterium]
MLRVLLIGISLLGLSFDAPEPPKEDDAGQNPSGEEQGQPDNDEKESTRLDLHIKFYSGPKAAKIKEASQWVEQVQWWIDGTNANCEDLTHIDGVINEGNDESKLPGKKKIFVTDSGKVKPSKKYYTLHGEAALRALGFAPPDPRFFHVAFFEKVTAKPQTSSGSGNVPGKYYAPNIVAADNVSKLYDKRHEVGHFFGLPDGAPGLMTKKYKSHSGGYYDSPNDFQKAWCSTIKTHLNL